MGAVLRADPVGAVQEGRFTMEIDLMVAAAAGANSGVVPRESSTSPQPCLQPLLPPRPHHQPREVCFCCSSG